MTRPDRQHADETLPGSEIASFGRVVNLRGWPGLDNWTPPRQAPPFQDRLIDRVGLVFFAGAAPTTPERFGLGGWLDIAGRSRSSGGFVVPDDADPNAFASCRERFGMSGAVTRTEFFDPRGGVFVKRCYSGGGWCIGADLGHSLSLPAEHCGARKGKHANEWEVWLPGWGAKGPKGWKRISPHRPALYLKARRVGWQVEFGPCGKDQQGMPAGKRIRGRAWQGAFVDVLSLAYALDADRAASFAEHRVNFGLPPFELPITVDVDQDGAARIAETLYAIHELVVALDGC
jgi:hypothetical protein